MAVTNKDDHNKDNYKEILAKLVKEKLDEIKKLTNEINQNDCHRFDECNDIKLFPIIKSAEMKLEDAKEMKNVFKSD